MMSYFAKLTVEDLSRYLNRIQSVGLRSQLIAYIRFQYILNYRICLRISRPTYKPTPIPTAKNLEKNSDPRISR